MFYGMCIFPMHAVSNPIIQTSTVQGHPRAKVRSPNQKPIDGLLPELL